MPVSAKKSRRAKPAAKAEPVQFNDLYHRCQCGKETTLRPKMHKGKPRYEADDITWVYNRETLSWGCCAEHVATAVQSFGETNGSTNLLPRPPAVSMVEAHAISLWKCVAYLQDHFISFRGIIGDDEPGENNIADGVLEKQIFDAFQSLMKLLQEESRNVGGAYNEQLFPDREYLKRLADQIPCSHYMPIEDLREIQEMHKRAERNAGHHAEIYERRYACHRPLKLARDAEPLE